MTKKILIILSLLLVAVSKNNVNAQEHEKWAIGHGDLTVDYVDSEWVFSFHQENEDHDQTMVLDQNSRNIIPDVSTFDFLGKAGSPIWIIPQITTEGIPFMGFNSNLTVKGIFEQETIRKKYKSRKDAWNDLIGYIDCFDQASSSCSNF